MNEGFTLVTGTVLIADGETPDNVGDIFCIDGVQFPEKVTVLKDFDPSVRLGVADLFRVDNRIECRFRFPSSDLPEFDLYFAIEGRTIETELVVGSDTKKVTKCRIDSISLCASKNADDRIGPIKKVLV